MSAGAWGRRCHRHVHGRVAGQCAGIWDAPLALGRTDVVQGLLALDARTWHMGCWHWTYGTWPREDVPDLGLTGEDVGLLRG